MTRRASVEASNGAIHPLSPKASAEFAAKLRVTVPGYEPGVGYSNFYFCQALELETFLHGAAFGNVFLPSAKPLLCRGETLKTLILLDPELGKVTVCMDRSTLHLWPSARLSGKALRKEVQAAQHVTTDYAKATRRPRKLVPPQQRLDRVLIMCLQASTGHCLVSHQAAPECHRHWEQPRVICHSCVIIS
eukprot:4818588-Amphidinium_carterae.1